MYLLSISTLKILRQVMIYYRYRNQHAERSKTVQTRKKKILTHWRNAKYSSFLDLDSNEKMFLRIIYLSLVQVAAGIHEY